jgi:hypothetical protein
MNVPAGKHEIEMVFRPERYYVLKTVATAVSISMIVVLIFACYRAVQQSLKASGQGAQGVQSRPQPKKSDKTSRRKA